MKQKYIKIVTLFMYLFYAGIITFAQNKYKRLALPDTVKNAKQIISYIDKVTLQINLSQENIFNEINEEFVKASLRNDTLQMMLAHFYLARLYLFDENYAEARKNYSSALSLLNTEKYPEMEGAFYARIGRAYEEMYNYDSALVYYKKSLAIRQLINDTVGIVNSYNFLGRALMKQGKYDLAFEYFTQALSYLGNSSKPEMKAFTYINLSLIFAETGDFNYAEKYLYDALKLRKKGKRELYVGHTYFRLAELFYKEKKYDKAIEYSLKALSIYDKYNFTRQLAPLYNFLGLCYLSKNNFTKSEEFLVNARQMVQQSNRKIIFAKNALYFGKLYNAKGKDYNKAALYLQEALETAKQIGLKSVVAEAYKEIAVSYFNTGKYKEAYLAKEEYRQLTNEIYNTAFAQKVARFANMKEIEKASLAFEFEQRKNEIIQKAKIRRERLIRNIFIGVSLFFVIFVILLYYQIRQKGKINKELLESTKLIKEKQAQILKQRDTLIKQKKELTETLKDIMVLKKAIEQSPNAIVITDKEGNIEYVNPKFEEVTGYTFDEMKGKNSRILQSGNKQKNFYKELWDTILSGNEWRGEFENVRKNGEIYIEHASISPVKDENGNIIHFVAVKEDITEQQKVMAEFEKLTAMQTKVFSIIGHDLRSPLGSIKSILEFLLERDYVRENEELSKILSTVFQSIVSISFLSENLLNWGASWLKGSEPRLKEFLINNLIEENINLLKSAAKRKNIVLKNNLSQKLWVIADEEMISIVIRNLIANAIKFTPTNGSVSVYGKKTSDTEIEISIEDTGIGIQEDVIPVLLDEYNLYTTPGTDKEKGSGLGLSICVQFIKKNNGRLTIESEVGKGSIFKFTLPAQTENKPKASNSKLESSPEMT